MMSDLVYSLIILALFVALIIGLVKPRLVLPWSKKPNRWKVLGWWFLAIVIVLAIIGLVNEKSRKLGDLTPDELRKMQNVLEKEMSSFDAETLDSIEIADRERKSLRAMSNNGIYGNGWVYRYIDLYEGDILNIPIGGAKNYLYYRVRLSDLITDSLFSSVSHIGLVAIDKNMLYSSESSGLYKQPIRSEESVLLKKIENNNISNYIDNVIVFDGIVYYTEPVDSVADIRQAVYNICSIKTDGFDDKKLTGRYYRDFCIYKGMIFARRGDSYEIEKLDINGNQLDNYGKISYEYFDVYNGFIYYLDNNHKLYKIDIETKKKQMINNNDRTKLNPVITRNHLFFNTQRQNVGQNYYSANSYGDLCSINLESGEMKKIYTEHLCRLSGMYNGILYCKEFIESDSIQGQGNIVGFQINIDGTNKKSVPF